VEKCGPCPIFGSFTLAFALQLRKNHGKVSVRLRKTSEYSIHITKTTTHYKTSVRVQYTYYQNTHTLQNLSQSTVYILPKHPHITKPQSEYSIHITKTPTHYKTHTNTHYKTHTHTYPHITEQYKTTTVQIKTNTVQDIPK